LARTSVQKLGTDLLFQRLDVETQGRLTDMQALGRAAEVKFSGDGDEIAKLIDLHCSDSQIKCG
jgi:hypothetical protein